MSNQISNAGCGTPKRKNRLCTRNLSAINTQMACLNHHCHFSLPTLNTLYFRSDRYFENVGSWILLSSPQFDFMVLQLNSHFGDNSLSMIRQNFQRAMPNLQTTQYPRFSTIDEHRSHHPHIFMDLACVEVFPNSPTIFIENSRVPMRWLKFMRVVQLQRIWQASRIYLIWSKIQFPKLFNFRL